MLMKHKIIFLIEIAVVGKKLMDPTTMPLKALRERWGFSFR